MKTLEYTFKKAMLPDAERLWMTEVLKHNDSKLDVKSLKADEISEKTDLPIRDVEVALFLMYEIGEFNFSGPYSDREYHGLRIVGFPKDDTAFDGFLRYESLEQSMEAFYKRRTRTTSPSLNPYPGTGQSFTTYGNTYVNIGRIRELETIKSTDFDLTKLIQLCKELNKCFSNQCYLSCAMLLRAIIDHVPPIFECKNFRGVWNNYKGSRSFKQLMERLDQSFRKIADIHLHDQIQRKEILPNQTQVDYSNDLDVLLSEIIRRLK